MSKILCIWMTVCMAFSGCASGRKNFCASKYMNDRKFIYFENGDLTSNFFLIKDSVQLEFSEDGLYSEATISWSSCYDYQLILRKAYYGEEGLRPGDTLFVKIQSLDKDTLHCVASAYGHSVPMKLLMVDID